LDPGGREIGMDQSRNRSMPLAIGLLVLLLAAASASLRAIDEGYFDRSVPVDRYGKEFCLGFSHGGEELGLACGHTPGEAVAVAVHRLDLPRGCIASVLPTELANGQRILFTGRGDSCRVEGLERLSGRHRLLVGAGLDVNRDSARDLTALSGIGETKARRIVESRIRDGPFGDIDELTRVEGIGPKTVERLAPWLEW